MCGLGSDIRNLLGKLKPVTRQIQAAFRKTVSQCSMVSLSASTIPHYHEKKKYTAVNLEQTLSAFNELLLIMKPVSTLEDFVITKSYSICILST